MARLLIKLAVFVAIMFSILWCLDAYYTRYTNTHKNVCQKPDWILNHTNQSYDFAFIGNSRTYNMTDVPMIERKTGKSGINLSETGSNYSELYVLLYEFLKNGNTVKNLIVQVDMVNLDTREYQFKFHNYSFMHLFSDPVVYDIYKENNPFYKILIWKYIPFTRYMEFSNRFVFYKIVKGGFECKTDPGLDTSRGGAYLSGSRFYPEKPRPKWIVQDFDNKYLDKLVDFAREKNIHVIFYTAPVYSKYLSSAPNNYDEIIRFLRSKAQAKNIPYFDFSSMQNPICGDVRNFYDNTHMNITGTRLFAAGLADSLSPVLK